MPVLKIKVSHNGYKSAPNACPSEDGIYSAHSFIEPSLVSSILAAIEPTLLQYLEIPRSSIKPYELMITIGIETPTDLEDMYRRIEEGEEYRKQNRSLQQEKNWFTAAYEREYKDRVKFFNLALKYWKITILSLLIFLLELGVLLSMYLGYLP